MRTALVFTLVSIVTAAAGRRLIPAPKGEPLPEQAAPAARADTLVVVIAADLLQAADSRPLLTDLWKQFHKTRPRTGFLVAVLSAGQVTPVGPHPTAAAFEKELAPLLPRDPDAAPATVDPRRLYDAMLAALPEPSEKWQTVLWAGRFPDLAGEKLRNHASARVAEELGGRRVSLSLWTADAAPPAWLAAQVTDFSGPVAELAAGTPETLPSIEAYGRLLDATDAACEATASRPQLDALLAALPAQPAEPESLVCGAALAERLSRWREAADLLRPQTEAAPQNPLLARRYAMALYERGPIPESAEAMDRAWLLNPQDPVVAERLGRIRLTAKDVRGAFDLFGASLALAPGNETLWWIRADLARELKESGAERSALAAALELNPSKLDRRARIIRLSLDAKQKDAARRWLSANNYTIPAAASDLADFAAFWEEAGESGPALELWRRSVAADPSFEPGHLASARILMARGDFAGSLKAAEEGLSALARSPGLHESRILALDKLDRWQDARRAATEAARTLATPRLKQLHAELETYFGGAHSVEAWQAWTQAVGGPERPTATGKGAEAALLAGSPEAAAAMLGLKPVSAEASQAPDQTTLIPGGAAALAFLTGIRSAGSPDTVLVDVARSVVIQHTRANKPDWDEHIEPVFDAYRRMLRIQAFGKPGPLKTVVTLSTSNKTEKQRTQQILELLGYRIRVNNKGIAVEAGTKKKSGLRQGLAAALEIDEPAMEEALEAGKPFSFDIPLDRGAVVLGEAVWKGLYAREFANPMGMAGVLLSEPKAAALYAGISALNPKAASALVARFGLKAIGENFTDLLLTHGAALSLNSRDECLWPGGEPAEQVWSALAGVSPRKGPAFMQALLTRDEGMLLAYFSLLHSVTPDRQRYFLASARRAQTYYQLLRDAPEWKRGAGSLVRKSPIAEFFRDVPLDADGSVHFPGGIQVWQVARGESDLSRVDKLARKASKAMPADEDALLPRIAKSRYEASSERISQLENLIAVARIEVALGRPLEPREALILSQKFGGFEWAYPFFTLLPGLEENHFELFFGWVESWQDRDKTEQQTLMGLAQELYSLAGLLSRYGVLEPQQAAAVFEQVTSGLKGAQDRAAWTATAAKALRALLAAIPAQGADPLATLENGLLPDTGAGPSPAQRRRSFRAILDHQKLPPLSAILDLIKAAETVAEGPAQAVAAVKAIEGSLPSLVVMTPPKGSKPLNWQKDHLEFWRVSRLQELTREIRQKASRKKPNPKDFPKLSSALMEELASWTELCLRGVIYAFYLRDDDLPVTEDPFLVRKHQFIAFHADQRRLFSEPGFNQTTDGLGSYVEGPLSGFSTVAGQIGAAGRRSARGFAERLEQTQIGAIRNMLLRPWREADLRAVALARLAGRQWVVDASAREPVRAALLEASSGLLAAERLARLAVLLEPRASKTPPPAQEFEGRWRAVWALFSHGDLIRLGLMRSQAGEPGELLDRLRSAHAAARPETFDDLAPPLLEHARSARPRFARLPPYEVYASDMMPARFAERLSELPLVLACAADEAGLPPWSLPVLADRAAQTILEKLDMNSPADFQTVLDLWNRLDGPMAAALFEEVRREKR
jgi:tetratricopeptide (TPR) repeat protein